MNRTEPRTSSLGNRVWIEGTGGHSADLDSERWELIDAPWGSGSWLLAIGAYHCRAWAPPGVMLNGAEEEPVEWWKTMAWPGQPDDVIADPPARVERLSVPELYDIVPADFRPWIVSCTEDQIRILARFVRSRRESDPKSAAEVELIVAELTEQLTQARQPAAVITSLAVEAAAARWREAFATLSDHDFALAVGDVVGRELKAPVRFAQVSEDSSYVLECVSEGRRILLQIRHDCRKPPREAPRSIGPLGYHYSPSPRDEHWLISSAPLHFKDTNHESGDGPPHRICDANALTELFDRHPAAVSRHLKLRVASEAPQRKSPSALLGYAQTHQTDLARHQLHEEGLVIVCGGAGMGKTALANLLLAEATVEGYDPVYVDSAEGLEDALRTSEPQAILWDDFTPGAGVFDLLAVARSLSNSRFILTTALQVHSDLAVSLDDYSRRDRAHILYNHLWAAWRDRTHPAAPADACSYLCLLDDPLFSPRRAKQVARGDAHKRAGCVGPVVGAEADEESHHLVARIRAGVFWGDDPT